MLEPNSLKITTLFPILGNDGLAFSAETWSWWLDSIMSFGAYHEFFTRGSWEGQTEMHRCITMVIQSEAQLRAIETFLHEARVRFEQDVMYFEATQVHFRLI